MRTTDLKATSYAVVIFLAVGCGLVPTVMHSSQASHRGAAVAFFAQSHRLTADTSPDNNPWD